MAPALQGVSSSALRQHWAVLFVVPLAVALSPIDHVLAGMVAAGQGIEAICLYLGLAREALFERIVALGLATPHDRAMRRPGGKRPWQASEVHELIRLWLQGIRVVCIAEQIGRTPGAVSSKARRLGLPKRDRKLLVRLDPPHRLAVQSGGEIAHPLKAKPEVAVPQAAGRAAEPVAFRASSPVVARSPGNSNPAARQHELPLLVPAQPVREVGVAPAPKCRKGHKVPEFKWTPEIDLELSMRGWALQHYKAIFRDMKHYGIGSASAIVCRLSRLQVPRKGEVLVDGFDEAVARERIARKDWVLRFCPIKKRGFWSPRVNGRRTRSNEAEKSRTYQNLDAGLW